MEGDYVIGVFEWFIKGLGKFLVFEMLSEQRGKPSVDMTDAPDQAYRWKTRQAAGKYLRENAGVMPDGCQVVNLKSLGYGVEKKRRLDPRQLALIGTEDEDVLEPME